jgi:outer membrane protein OmpA-like peptidoglycan-associated protein
MTRRGIVSLVLFLGVAAASSTALSWDNPTQEAAINKAIELNKAGEFSTALKWIDRSFQGDLPLMARVCKAESLVGLGQVSEAFSLIGEIRGVLEKEERFEIAAKVLFEYNKSTLRPEAEEQLNRVLSQIKGKQVQIRVDGHTDNVGGDTYNLSLSRERAEAVQVFLVSAGVDAAKIITKGWGMRRPVVGNDTDQGRQQNRRVEFIVTGQQQVVARKHLTRIAAKLPKQGVSVTTIPAGAQVWFDNELVKGMTPFNKELSLGLHSVRLFLRGYKVVNTSIFVEPGKENILTHQFTGGPGSLTVTVDQDDLTLEIDGKTVALTKGANDVGAVSAGQKTAIFFNKARKSVHQANVSIRAAERADLTYLRYAQILSKYGDASLEVLSEADKAPKGASLTLDTGKYTLVARRPGYVPIQGLLSVQAGQRITITNDFGKIPEHTEHRLWALITSSVGLGLVAVAVTMELVVDQSAEWVDTTNFAVGGLGGALFVTGGILYGYIDAVEDPDPEPVDFSILLGMSPMPNGAAITAFGRF